MKIQNARRILICGSRHYTDKGVMRDWFERFHEETVIIHGACKGADLLAQDLAIEFELDYLGFPARWTKEGKAAGPIRNQRMIRLGRPDYVLAFHKNIAKSKGTSNMVSQARKLGITTNVVIE
jgi:hypothetical protein